MNSNRTLAASAIATLLGLALASPASADEGSGKRAPHEKCYGIVRQGQNDCASVNHSCAGEAKADGDASEWLYVPKGSCEKIVGGSLTAAKK
jgi:uncharacterized membrane protein